MSATYQEVGTLLRKWKDSRQAITVLFSSETDNWRRSGKISYVYFGKFDVEWGNGGSVPISYLAIANISEDEQTLNLSYTAAQELKLRNRGDCEKKSHPVLK